MELNINNSLGYALTTTLNTLRKSFNNAIKEYNLTSEQYGVLKLVNEFKGLIPSEIAKLLARDKANVTRVVNSLLKKGFIKKQSINKKSYKILLTKEGEYTLKKVEEVAIEFDKHIRKLIGEDEYNLIVEKLKFIREHF